MLTEAAGLAVLAALSPTAVLVSAVFLSSANPHRTVAVYLAGAIVMTAIFAAVVFVALRAGHLQRPPEHQPRYGLRLGLGILMMLAGGYLRRRKPKPPDPAKRDKRIISRLLARPRPWAAFVVGLLVYAPSLTFIAAVQVVATSRASIAASVLDTAVVIAITVMFAWLPFTAYLLAPERTAGVLRSCDGWLRSHGYVLAVAGLGIGGVLVTLDGILGLTGVVG
ncbi:MAG TPA: GAP family protein [Streptosporangiaceae bacterium]|nr:GAP family protein [Streptosporangiaceae bacterium]